MAVIGDVSIVEGYTVLPLAAATPVPDLIGFGAGFLPCVFAGLDFDCPAEGDVDISSCSLSLRLPERKASKFDPSYLTLG